MQNYSTVSAEDRRPADVFALRTQVKGPLTIRLASDAPPEHTPTRTIRLPFFALKMTTDIKMRAPASKHQMQFTLLFRVIPHSPHKSGYQAFVCVLA